METLIAVLIAAGIGFFVAKGKAKQALAAKEPVKETNPALLPPASPPLSAPPLVTPPIGGGSGDVTPYGMVVAPTTDYVGRTFRSRTSFENGWLTGWDHASSISKGISTEAVVAPNEEWNQGYVQGGLAFNAGRPRELPMGALAPFSGDASRAQASCGTGTFSSASGKFCVDPRINPHPNPEANLSREDGTKGTVGSDVAFATQDGVASYIGHQWCVTVGDGDTAGRIAEEITGDRARYVELLSANPEKAQTTSPELNFASLCVGERLYIPKSWNYWIDQNGHASGGKPFAPYDKLPAYPSPDMRKATMGLVPWPEAAPTGWKALEEVIIERGVG